MIDIENWDNSEIITEARVNFEEYESSIFMSIYLYGIYKNNCKNKHISRTMFR